MKNKCRIFGIHNHKDFEDGELFLISDIEGEIGTDRLISGFIFEPNLSLSCRFTVKESGLSEEIDYIYTVKSKYELRLIERKEAK